MAKVATPKQDGSTWWMRRRVYGQDLYVSGHSSPTAAKQAMKALVDSLEDLGRPKGYGPNQTTLAQALQDYGLERLPFLKGADKDVNRINRWLRAAGLATLKATPWAESKLASDGERTNDARGTPQFFVVELEAPQEHRTVPRGLVSHRRLQEQESARTDNVRAYVAGLPMAEVQTHHVQSLIDARRIEGKEPATLQQEQATLRCLFNHARRSWHWGLPKVNPATELKLPRVDNGRDRVMSAGEQARLDEAIGECRNHLVGPTMTLLTETALRASEPIKNARWSDVDWTAKVLALRDAKGGKRRMPLSPKAIEALRQLQALTGGAPDDRVVGITYEAMKAAWTRACQRAGVDDLRIHDLRHTAATRMALKSGNVFLVKALTGHKTMSMLERYVNVKAEDVVAFMHAEAAPAQAGSAEVPPEATLAPPKSEAPSAVPAAPAPTNEAGDADAAQGVVIRVDFGRRRLA